jgi:HAD superfamily hydrolase (TIGR01490 family)
MPLAIFDLDETLIAADSDHEWGQFVIDRGLVNSDEHKYMNDNFYTQYKAGELNIDEYLKFSCSVLAQHSMDELLKHRSAFVRERILPTVLAKGVALVEQHRNKGDTLLVITSTIEFVTRPIVDHFGIDTLIAPIPEIIGHQYTGNIVGVPSFKEGKVTRLRQWLENHEHSLDGSYFYSDSHNDLPLLRIVSHPVAVDPDPVLQVEAEANQWQVISLRN